MLEKQETNGGFNNGKLLCCQPGVEIATCVDGFGPPGTKIDDYRMVDKDQLIQYSGMKLFYTLDKPLMSPNDVLALDPSPLMVMYQ